MINANRGLNKKSPAVHWLLAAALAAATAACGSDDPAGPADEGMPRTPGIHNRVLPPGNQRYTIFIPSGFDAGQPTPLILSLHYGGVIVP